MGVKIEVTVRCINDNTSLYSCDASYSLDNNTLVQSEVDDYQKQCLLVMASDALYMTHTLLKNQIKTELSNKEIVGEYVNHGNVA